MQTHGKITREENHDRSDGSVQNVFKITDIKAHTFVTNPCRFPTVQAISVKSTNILTIYEIKYRSFDIPSWGNLITQLAHLPRDCLKRYFTIFNYATPPYLTKEASNFGTSLLSTESLQSLDKLLSVYWIRIEGSNADPG